MRSEFSRAGGFEAGLDLLSRGGRPDAVFVTSDVQALGLLAAARRLHLDVPSDLAVVSFDGTEDAVFSDPRSPRSSSRSIASPRPPWPRCSRKVWSTLLSRSRSISSCGIRADAEPSAASPRTRPPAQTRHPTHPGRSRSDTTTGRHGA
ncbi:substrate-binding domain-containing protein [Microbacterium sp. Se5.02b]|uniref:substrate-binding domain-containing protein n=1 Tax=Microbacterium sp. Se5.02b TaxID=2864103 RepID=UPI0037CAFBF5